MIEPSRLSSPIAHTQRSRRSGEVRRSASSSVASNWIADAANAACFLDWLRASVHRHHLHVSLGQGLSQRHAELTESDDHRLLLHVSFQCC